MRLEDQRTWPPSWKLQLRLRLLLYQRKLGGRKQHDIQTTDSRTKLAGRKYVSKSAVKCPEQTRSGVSECRKFGGVRTTDERQLHRRCTVVNATCKYDEPDDEMSHEGRATVRRQRVALYANVVVVVVVFSAADVNATS